MVEEARSDARVLAQDEAGAAEEVERAERDIAQVSDGRRDQGELPPGGAGRH